MKLVTSKSIVLLRAALVFSLALSFVSCKEKGPREYIVDDNTVVNIGTIKEADGTMEFVILYKNDTPDTMVATHSRSSCHCTAPVVNNLPIPPGELIF